MGPSISVAINRQAVYDLPKKKVLVEFFFFFVLLGQPPSSPTAAQDIYIGIFSSPTPTFITVYVRYRDAFVTGERKKMAAWKGRRWQKDRLFATSRVNLYKVEYFFFHRDRKVDNPWNIIFHQIDEVDETKWVSILLIIIKIYGSKCFDKGIINIQNLNDRRRNKHNSCAVHGVHNTCPWPAYVRPQLSASARHLISWESPSRISASCYVSSSARTESIIRDDHKAITTNGMHSRRANWRKNT